MLVTGIHLGRDRLYRIYSGRDVIAVLDDKAVAEAGIKESCDISEEKLLQLVFYTDVRRAKAKALLLLSRRDYCSTELRRRLCNDFDEEAVLIVIDELSKNNYINDERYAENAAYSLIKNRHFSPERAVIELSVRGVDREIAQYAVDDATERLDYSPGDIIYSLIEKKYPGCNVDEKIERRCYNAMLRLGYSKSDIINAIESYKYDKGQDNY